LAGDNIKPLAGKRIVVTRAPEQAEPLGKLLAMLGAEVVFLPTVTFSEPADSDLLDQAVERLDEFDWVLFTSANAAHFFGERCRRAGRMPPVVHDRDRYGLTQRVPGYPSIAAVGPATSEAAVAAGFVVDYEATEFRGLALAAELGPRLTAKRILLPRSNRASNELPAALAEAGAIVVDVVAYETRRPEAIDASVIASIRRCEVDAITVMSPSAFHNLADEVGLDELRGIANRVALAAVGPVTAEAMTAAGLHVAIVASESTAIGLGLAVARHFGAHFTSELRPI
jgi:uroporphyrinogen III methyltransferase/synthase